ISKANASSKPPTQATRDGWAAWQSTRPATGRDSAAAIAKDSGRARILGVRLVSSLVSAVLIVGTAPMLFSQNTPPQHAGGAAQILTADDVRAVLTVA